MAQMSADVHSFSECKSAWEQLNITEQEQTFLAVSEIWNSPSESIDKSVPEDVLSMLQGKGILNQDQEGEWKFTLPQMLSFVQALNFIRSQQLHTQSADSILQNLLQLLRLRGARRSHQQGTLVIFIVAHLVNEFSQVNLLESFVRDEVSKEDFWQMYDPICKALPVLELAAETFALLLEMIAIRVQDDIMKAVIYEAAEQLGYFKPDVASQLLDIFAKANNPVTGNFLNRLMVGVAMSSSDNLDRVLAMSKEWLRSSKPILCQTAVYCMQNLTLNGKLASGQLMANIDPLIDEQVEGVAYSVAVTLAKIGASHEDHYSDCFSRLKNLKRQSPIGEVTHGIAVGLSRSRDDAALKFKFDCCSSLLTDVPVSDKDTIQWIDTLLYPFYPQNVWQFLEKWVQNHEHQESITADNMFLHTIREAYKRDPDLGRQVVTYWFSSSDLRLVEEGRSVLQKLSLENFAPEVIQTLPPERIIYITEKLLVWPPSGLQLMRLLHSILQNAKGLEELADYFSDILKELIWNLPGGVQDFLEQTLTEDDDSVVSQLLRRAHQQLQNYQKQRRDIFVAELAPSQYRIRQYLGFQNKQFKKAQEAVLDERGGILSFVHRVNIARGDRSFYMNIFHSGSAQGRTFSVPSGFGHFEHSMEMPRDELLDPEGSAWRRLQRKNLRAEVI